MKKQALITIFFLLLTIGKVAGQACALEAVSGPANQTVCAGTAITDIKYTLTGATAATPITLPAGLSSGFAASVVTISGIPTESGNYSVTLTDGSTSCTSTGTITMNPVPTFSTATQLGATCSGTKARIHLTGLLTSTPQTIHYTINGASQTDVPLVYTSETEGYFDTRNLSYPADNGDALQITSITVNATSCTKSFINSLDLLVAPLPTLGTVTVSNACDGGTAQVTVNGLLVGSISTINYRVNGDIDHFYTQTGVNTEGNDDAVFTSQPLEIDNNGQNLVITRVTNEATACYTDFTDNDRMTVNPLPAPVITGSSAACAGSAGNTYSTASSMSNYAWSISGGTITSATNIRTITVKWGPAGLGTLSVTSTSGVCSGTSPVHNVTISPNPSPSISGDDAVCNNSTNIYSTTAGMQSYTWSVPTGGIITSSADGSSISVTWNNTGSHSVKLSFTTPTGCTTAQASLPIEVSPLPVLVISSPELQAAEPRINDVITYTTGGSSGYAWQVSSGGSGSSSTSSINVTWNATGAQTVKVNYVDGNGCTALAPATYNVNVKPLPAITGLHLDGYPSIGTSMTADYIYTDGSSGDPAGPGCTYRWFSAGSEISGANAKTYLPKASDLNKTLTIEVTPVSNVGPPFSGLPVTSPPSDPIEDIPAGVPVADLVCIEGTRVVNNVIRGKYRYNFNKAEGSSLHKWYRKNTLTGDSIHIASGIDYQLTEDDLAENMEISFTVIPKSSNKTPLVGEKASSKPLARIIGLKDQYSITEPDVALTPNVPGGYFAGLGIAGNIFSPSVAGEGTHEINYFRFYEYASHTCSQRAPQTVVVNPNVAFFSAIDDVYCHDDPAFVVNVSNVPAEAINQSFGCTDPGGIISSSTFSATIDPSKMSPGSHKLYYSYTIELISMMPFPLPPRVIDLYYKIEEDFVIDKVSTEMKFLGLDTAYCENEDQKYISVEGVYPLGGTGYWTGDLLVSPTEIMSAYLDPESGAAGNRYNITYQYKSPLGCFSPELIQRVKINPLPNPEFILDPTYNIKGDPVTLVPVSANGIFTGHGISGNMLFPDIAGAGFDTISYKITDKNNCTAVKQHITNIRSAQGIFTDIPSLICYKDTTYKVKVSGLPVDGTDGRVSIKSFTNLKGTIKASGSNADYYVPDAGEGPDMLIFEYVWDDVDYRLEKNINIDRLDQVVLYNLDPGQIICDDALPFDLGPSISGGVFTGPVFEGKLLPSAASRNDIVTYTYTSPKTGCKTTAKVPINVYPAPKVAFEPVDVCIDDDTDITFFRNNTTSGDPIDDRWHWEFFEDGVMHPDSMKREAGYLYKKSGLQKVALTAETNMGCSVRKEATFDLARRPVADFYWKDDCMHQGESISLFDTTQSTVKIKSRDWRVSGTTGFFSSSTSARYPKTDTGFLRIEYIVRTDFANCNDNIIKDIYIRPTITVPTDGYLQNFETSANRWIKADTTGVWSFGTPDGMLIKNASSGHNAWYTDRTIRTSASVESPCFDFSVADRPVIKLRIWKMFEKDRDGGALQYKIGNNREWQYVGTIDDGIEWYNSATIRGEPGGNQLGWTTTGLPDNDWKEAIHTLDELRGKTNVKFRIAYGSEGSYLSHDGMAFDDIWIGNRSRHVLFEHFTNFDDSRSVLANVLVDTIASHKKSDVINIQYHTNFPGTDPFYDNNPGDASARILFYGLTKAPYTFIDGGTKNDFAMVFDNDLARIDSNYVTKRSLVNALFNITLDPVISGRRLSVKGTITAVENLDSAILKNLTLFLAITEKKNIYTSESGQVTTFNNVFRKFLPDAGGIILSKTASKSTWAKGESIAIGEHTWTIEKVLNSSDIEIIAFIQNSITREVYQAFSVIKPKIAVGSENPSGSKQGSFSVYPNPAHKEITIAFGEPLSAEADIRIYNNQGQVIRTYKAGPGTLEFPITESGLRGGIYMVRVSSGRFDLGFKKLIVIGD